jgi:glycerol-3-phosphate dehydrogenase
MQSLHAPVVVNAAGIWGQRIAEYADLSIRMFPAKGSLLIMDHRINQHVINRCRKPSDADILVPGDTISLIGTTSQHIDYDDIDSNRVTAEEVDILLREGENWRRLWRKRAFYAPTPACVRWWPATTIPPGVTSAVGLYCSITPSVTDWKGLSPLPAAN